MKAANFAPVYACVYPKLAEIARSHGYALAAHGSLARDFDLICIPWVVGASDPQSVVNEVVDSFAFRQEGAPEQKEHGRIAYTISFEFGECRLDLSFMPAAAHQPARQPNPDVARLREALESARNYIGIQPVKTSPWRDGNRTGRRLEDGAMDTLRILDKIDAALAQASGGE